MRIVHHTSPIARKAKGKKWEKKTSKLWRCILRDSYRYSKPCPNLKLRTLNLKLHRMLHTQDSLCTVRQPNKAKQQNVHSKQASQSLPTSQQTIQTPTHHPPKHPSSFGFSRAYRLTALCPLTGLGKLQGWLGVQAVNGG